MKSLMKMKVLLRNRETGQFYAGSRRWSRNTSAAHNFETLESAVQLARTHRLAGMEVCLRCDDPTWDTVLPFRQDG